MPTATIELRGFQSARSTASELAQQVSSDRLEVVVSCQQLQGITTSFADELVRHLLVEHGSLQLILDGAPARVRQHFQHAAQRRGVSGRLHTG